MASIAAAIHLSGCNIEKTSSTEQQNGPTNIPKEPTRPSQPEVKKDINFKEWGIIREFGGSDNAALFLLLPDSGHLVITKITGPQFLKTYMVGELNRNSVAKLFLNTSKPLSQNERQDLLSKYNGATALYMEGYSGNLCTRKEITYEITAIGKVDGTDIEITFRFEAIPNPDGNCDFHQFGIITSYVN